MNYGPANGRSDLDVRQVKRRIENVKGAVAQFVVRQLSLLERRFLVDDYKRARIGSRAESVVHKTCVQQLNRRQQVPDFAYILACGAIHTAPAGMKSCRISKNGRFH